MNKSNMIFCKHRFITPGCWNIWVFLESFFLGGGMFDVKSIVYI